MKTGWYILSNNITKIQIQITDHKYATASALLTIVPAPILPRPSTAFKKPPVSAPTSPILLQTFELDDAISIPSDPPFLRYNKFMDWPKPSNYLYLFAIQAKFELVVIDENIIRTGPPSGMNLCQSTIRISLLRTCALFSRQTRSAFTLHRIFVMGSARKRVFPSAAASHPPPSTAPLADSLLSKTTLCSLTRHSSTSPSCRPSSICKSWEARVGSLIGSTPQLPSRSARRKYNFHCREWRYQPSLVS